MLWCKKCSKKYKDDISNCPSCGTELNASNKNDGLEITLLFIAESDVEFALVTDALKKENILFSTETQKLWDHMQIVYNQSYVGQKVFVANDDYKKAKEIYDYFQEIKKNWSEDNQD